MSESKGVPSRRVPATNPKLNTMRADDGAIWSEYRRSLTPRYGRVWRDIAACYVALVGAYIGGIVLERLVGWPWSAVLFVPLAVWLGFWEHALLCFGHESAHWGLSASHRRNDQLADIFVWSWFGRSAAGYRRFHWEHHRHLGQPADTEVSYRQCLSPGLLVRLGTGLGLLDTVGRLQRTGDGEPDGGAEEGAAAVPSGITKGTAIRSAGLQIVVTLIPLLLGCPVVAAAWVGATILVYPGLNVIRQLLEHRRDDAVCADDFTHQPHGEVTRWFGNGHFARWYGAAGFNHHLFHHWDPSVSYTNLGEMERWVRAAGMGDDIDVNRRTYAGELRIQMRAARA